MLGMAWLTMGMALGLRRLRWAYGRPWQVASLTASVVAFGLAFYDFDAVWTAWVVTGTGVYFLAAVWAFHSSRYFYVAGLLLPFACCSSGTERCGVDTVLAMPLLALFPAGLCVGAGFGWRRCGDENGRLRNRSIAWRWFWRAHVGSQSGLDAGDL